MTRRALYRCAAALVVILAGAATAARAWKEAAPGYGWSFPRDHAAHPGYRTEWWYVTGQLKDEADRPRFAYQFTLFRVGLSSAPPHMDSEWAAQDAVMGHMALLDLSTGRRWFRSVLRRAAPLIGGFGAPDDRRLAWCRAPDGSRGTWSFDRTDKGFLATMEDSAGPFDFRLALAPEKPLVFEGPGGFSRKSAKSGASSLYYSFTRLSTDGRVRVGASTVAVRGMSWMDREFGSGQLARDQVGWDWFGLQLDDGRDVMLYLLRGKGGADDFAQGTIAPRTGDPRWLAANEFSVTTLARWKSAASGATYPARWRVRIPGAGEWTVTPIAADQENRGEGPGFPYWEGAVRVAGADGKEAGRGFVELTGYAAEKPLRF